MRNTRMMIRFLDLTLLLLMAFLLEADLSIELDVGLPHGDPNQSEGSVNETWMLSLQPTTWSMATQDVEHCSGENTTEIYKCLQDVVPPQTNVLITPSRGVVVQRLVDVLDVCVGLDVTCTAGGGS